MGSLPHIVEDCMGVLQLYSDGTVHRCSDMAFKFRPFYEDNSVVFKDMVYDQKLDLSLRLYKPKSTTTTTKIPLVIYFHGGGFCVGSRLWPNCHNCCLRLASGLGALVVSPDYRLAPEHKLPAAVEDAAGVVEWLRREADHDSDEEYWLSRKVIDFERVFVVGDSSGGNMAHHLAVRVGTGSVRTEPVRIRGFVLLAPFFGGVVRTKSEEGPGESLLSLDMLDRFWRLSMGEGETRDHPLANPLGPKSPRLEEVGLEPMLVIVGGNELLRDRVEEYAMRLKDMGKNVEYVEFEGQQHGFFTNDPYSHISNHVLQLIKRFILQNSSN
ncbi:hypothetical protein CsatB_019494 [Cannabis sativa]|uniref:Alpha/beta hydrolase fold-3 domain-containing protein n=2 Tax=Cannabis sativa TaxID=3483 RepID=A0A7J6FED5_CANSA|nr:hypothetical protein F8388_013382 [Cannabis sativa]KAF4402384.1 hypothetical protein G4B88_012169 [Cannabis sativa]